MSRITRIGRYVVAEKTRVSVIGKDPRVPEPRKVFGKPSSVMTVGIDGPYSHFVLVDEVEGKNHYDKAVKKAKLLDECDNPSPERADLNRRIVAAHNRDRMTYHPEFVHIWPLSLLRKEAKRLEAELNSESK
jgi:hypothetical protein